MAHLPPSRLMTHTEYEPACGGCGNTYGETFDVESKALAFLMAFPHCSMCEAA